MTRVQFQSEFVEEVEFGGLGLVGLVARSTCSEEEEGGGLLGCVFEEQSELENRAVLGWFRFLIAGRSELELSLGGAG